jgi:hypothetical protein
MNYTDSVDRDEGLTLRQAALIAGFGYLLGPVTYAEFSIYPRLVVAGNIEQTPEYRRSSGPIFCCHTVLSD